MKTTILLLSLCCSLPLLADEQVYQWIDEEGNMQFSQMPPKGITAKNIQLETASSYAEKEEKEEEKDAGNTDAPPLTDNMTPEQLYAHNCADLRKQQQQLSSGDKVATQEEGKETLRIMTKEQKKTAIEGLQPQIEKYCNGTPPKAKAKEEKEENN